MSAFRVSKGKPTFRVTCVIRDEEDNPLFKLDGEPLAPAKIKILGFFRIKT